jgi:hypothetical protein
LRPAVASTPSSSACTPPPIVRRICTTKSGKYWHVDYKCRFLELSHGILERSP